MLLTSCHATIPYPEPIVYLRGKKSRLAKVKRVGKSFKELAVRKVRKVGNKVEYLHNWIGGLE